MPRLARIVVPGCPHHITQRGNNRQDVFFVDDDRRAYLGILGAQARRFGLQIEGYSLMPNHIHLIATPLLVNSLAKALGRAHYLYALYVNRFHERTGHLWQNRFFSCALDEAHYWTAMCYVELNPVRAQLVRKAWQYEWSSAAEHCRLTQPREESAAGGKKLPAGQGLALEHSRWREMVKGRDWKQALGEGISKEGLADIRLRTNTGRPLGSDSWLAKLEVSLGRRLRAHSIGRPRKTPANR